MICVHRYQLRVAFYYNSVVVRKKRLANKSMNQFDNYLLSLMLAADVLLIFYFFIIIQQTRT